MNKELIEEIYHKMGDDLSKAIFSNRLLYSLTKDRGFIFRVLSECPESKDFYELINSFCGGGNFRIRLMGERNISDDKR